MMQYSYKIKFVLKIKYSIYRLNLFNYMEKPSIFLDINALTC
jgi:hypothetical protein